MANPFFYYGHAEVTLVSERIEEENEGRVGWDGVE
jgi:hypothetical protein